MGPGSRTSLLRGVLGLALCAAAVAGCGEEPQPVAAPPTARVSLTLRAQPEGVFTLRVVDPEGVSGDTWLEDHHGQIARKLTPSDIGTDEVKEISLADQRITIRTHVEDIADCEQQAGRIEQLVCHLYADLELARASTGESTPSDRDEAERVPPNIALFKRYLEATPSDLDEIRQVLDARAEAAGLSDVSAEPTPPDTLVVKFACAGDPEWAKDLLTQKGLVQFHMVPRRYALESTAAGETLWWDDTGTRVNVSDVVAQSPVILSGRDFAPTSRVETRSDQLGQHTYVTFSLQNEAREVFHTFTRDHVDTYLAMVLDGELISCPKITSAIPGGEGVIVADFDEPGGSDRAEKLAILINSGPLPLRVECVESSVEDLAP